jgi:redox-sensitive bicupin YhaK (pirin superfamily)
MVLNDHQISHGDLRPRWITVDDGTVLFGDFASARSPARHDTALGGLDLHLLGGGTTLPLDPGWEYAIVVLRGSVALGRRQVEPGRLAYLGRGRDELGLDAGPNTRAVLLGGVPFAEQIVMWWNFVARSRDDLSAAYAAWQAQDDRFGRVHSPLPRIPAPPPYWTTSSA